ncbi:MAG: 23S rRNA (adenine(2030)-N(6))-methyltransferase RlmJ [Treponema sp.]|nr:23S rRNA (adenine(2030)-N(6))-methyltransferase RlmJ [Treponema sp.]
MLSYRHIFHAGNHADVLKHSTLTILLEHFNAKNKPYTLIDTHAGAGRYNLDDERAQKTGEAANGINRLLDAPDIPEGIHQYTDFIRKCLREGFYPGSPEIERSLMNAQDSLIVCELHNTEIDILRRNMKLPAVTGQKACKVQIHHRDGYEALYALTPPPVKRGMVFTDPSYEDTAEYIQTADAFAAVHTRWPAAVLTLWYPLLAHRRIECGTMKQKITAEVKSSAVPCSILDVQLLVNTEDSHTETAAADMLKDNPPRLYGSGMLIVNYPWKTDEKLSAVLTYLARTLGTDNHGSWSVKIL